MMSHTVIKCLRNTAENGYFWGIATFYFCPRENRLIVSKSFWRKYFVHFNFSFYTTYAVFLLVRLLQMRYFGRDELHEESELLLEGLGLTCIISPFCCQLYFLWREETFANFINQYLIYYGNTEG